MSEKIFLLIKFGRERDMIDLFNNGHIYMNSINSFRQIEDNYLRGDSYEGIIQIWNLPPGQFEISTIDYKGNYLSLHLKKNHENILGNIYSFYCVSTRGINMPEDFQIDKRVVNFGSHAVVIKNLYEFFNRIERCLELTGHKYHHGFVKYYDKEKINKRITVFEKPNEFEYQKEFRFYLNRNEITPFSFKIGSLKDIAEILPSEHITHLKLTKV